MYVCSSKIGMLAGNYRIKYNQEAKLQISGITYETPCCNRVHVLDIFGKSLNSNKTYNV